MENNSELPQIRKEAYRSYAKELTKRIGRRVRIDTMHRWYNEPDRYPMPQDILIELTAIVAEAASSNQGDTDNGNYSRIDQ